MINLFYIALALVFASVMTYMVVYNLRHKTRRATQQKLGRPPVATEESIAVSTEADKLPDRR
jgi:hypothetical protein